ncbi:MULTISPECIES: type 1 periplasmic-binding domain-containing protein [Streptomyces]|uniref:hypothetical protein n=1 Tax=Streptomyces TaxID=1883 RepID=UPI001C3056A6|nr:hypothetical protein [Streptomyces sp. GbtcB7]
MTELSNPARSRALLIGAHSFTDPDLEPLPAVARNLDRLAELLRDFLAGGDGILATDKADLADGDICTVGGAFPDAVDSAGTFIKDYKKAGYKTPYGPFGGYAYDATLALIHAFKSVHVSPLGTTVPSTKRESLRAVVGDVDFDGAMGKVRFDANGDVLSPVVTVYRMSGGSWKAVKA